MEVIPRGSLAGCWLQTPAVCEFIGRTGIVRLRWQSRPDLLQRQ